MNMNGELVRKMSILLQLDAALTNYCKDYCKFIVSVDCHTRLLFKLSHLSVDGSITVLKLNPITIRQLEIFETDKKKVYCCCLYVYDKTSFWVCDDGVRMGHFCLLKYICLLCFMLL